MNTFKQNKLFWLSILVCAMGKHLVIANPEPANAAPVTAPAGQTTASSASKVLLTWAELTDVNLFKNVEIAKYKDGFQIRGTYPKACEGQLHLRGDAVNNRFGLEAASEATKDCLKNNAASSERLNLSDLSYFQTKGGVVSYYWEDTTQDINSSNRFKTQVVDEDYKTPSMLALEAHLAQQGFDAEKASSAMQDIQDGCNGDQEAFERAKAGLDDLSNMNLVTARQFKEISKALEEAAAVAELEKYSDQIADAGLSELKDLDKELTRLSRKKEYRRNDEAKEKIAVLMGEIVGRYRQLKQEEPKKAMQVCGRIKETVRDAQSISGLSAESRVDIKNIQNETDIDCVGEIARHGRKYNMLFDPNYNSLMARLGYDKDMACNSAINPTYMPGFGDDYSAVNMLDMSVCSKAIESQQLAQTMLPKIADAADQRIDAMLSKSNTATSTSSGPLALGSMSSLTGVPSYNYALNAAAFH